MELNCMVVDDELVSRSTVNRYIENTNFLNLQFECSNYIEAVNILQEPEADVDLIYL